MNEPTRQAALEAFKQHYPKHKTAHWDALDIKYAEDIWLACAEWMEPYATQAAYERAAQKLRTHANNQTYTAPSSPYEHAANLIEDMARALANESSGKGEKG